MNKISYWSTKGIKQHPFVEVENKDCIRYINSSASCIIGWEEGNGKKGKYMTFSFNILGDKFSFRLYGEPAIFMIEIEKFIKEVKEL